jgi:signal transduction histidine kinase
LELDGIHEDHLLSDHLKHYVSHQRDHHDRHDLVAIQCDLRDVMDDLRDVMDDLRDVMDDLRDVMDDLRDVMDDLRDVMDDLRDVRKMVDPMKGDHC